MNEGTIRLLGEGSIFVEEDCSRKNVRDRQSRDRGTPIIKKEIHFSRSKNADPTWTFVQSAKEA